jgi:hypothetical protein
MSSKFYFIFTFLFLFTQLSNGQNKPLVLLGGTAHIGNGKIVENSAIGIENGKISFVADAATIRLNPSEATILNYSGKQIYPGFISVNNILGLTEIEAVRATNDWAEVGAYSPHVRALIAFNPESKIIPTVRSNGILTVQSTPRGGVISGTSSIFTMEGWNWEDAVYKVDDAIHVNFPSWFNNSGWWAEPGTSERNKEYENQLKELRKFLLEAKAYCTISNQREKNLRLEAMRGVFEGSKSIFFNADYSKEILDIIQLKKELNIQKVVLVGGLDALSVVSAIKENGIPIVLNRLHELPNKSDAPIDQYFSLPKKLKEANILFCLGYKGGMEAMGVRNLPFVAGTAVAYGLSKEEALSSITGNTAKILGIEQTTGSLEVGKDATIFVSSGDALDMMTNKLERAWIKGKEIDLSNSQIELYEKYSKKLDLK